MLACCLVKVTLLRLSVLLGAGGGVGVVEVVGAGDVWLSVCGVGAGGGVSSAISTP